MPIALETMTDKLRTAVDAAYGYQGGKDDASRVAFLFARYAALTRPAKEESQ